MIFLFIGLSVLAKDALSRVPMPVLYGVFLYMGISSLKGVQLMDRISIFFMPTKHQPDYIYLRHVPLGTVKLFTLIQVGGLILLWTIKKSSMFSICFPLMIAAIVFIRRTFEWNIFGKRLFTRRELSWLDDVMPEEHRKEETTIGSMHSGEYGMHGVGGGYHHHRNRSNISENSNNSISERSQSMSEREALKEAIQRRRHDSIGSREYGRYPHHNPENEISISETLQTTNIWKHIRGQRGVSESVSSR